MKICLINPFSKFAAVRQYNLAKQLALKGHEVTLILPKFDNYSGFKDSLVPRQKNLRIIYPKQIQSSRMEVRMFPYLFDFFKQTKSLEFDIVHAFRPTPFSGLLGYLLSKKKKVPFVLELGDAEWQSMVDLNHPKYRIAVVKWLEKFLVKKSYAISVMNRYVQEYIETTYEIKTPILTLSNGVDFKLFNSSKLDKELRKQFELKTNAKKILLYHGKLDRVSHIKDMLYALKNLPSEYGLVITGDGDRKVELEQLSKDLELENRCYFVGRIPYDTVPKYFKTADVLLAPFVDDKRQRFASNLKLFEYMASGKPIVASNVGLIPAILGTKKYVYKSGSNVDFVLKIQNAYKDKVSFESKAKNYDWEKLSDHLMEFYNQLE